MKKQNYHNHVRYYAPQHFVFYPLIMFLEIFCFYNLFHDDLNKMIWFAIIGIVNLLCFLALMLRQHYALNNQNRIVRLELRLRYYILTGKRFEKVETQLSPNQVYALRFAPDEELENLIENAVQNNLSGNEIKQKINNWSADDMRV
jgi:hypothetical protein